MIGHIQRLFRKSDDELENTFVLISFSLARMRQMDFFDADQLINYEEFGAGMESRKALKILFTSKWRKYISVDGDLKENAEELLPYLKKLPLSYNQINRIGDFFWKSGIAGYGMPVAAFVKQESLIVAALRALAKGPKHFRQARTQNDRFDTGWYVVFSRRESSGVVEKSLICIQNIVKHEKGHRNRRLRIDARQGCIEITKTPDDEKLILRAGTLVNFDTYSTVFLSPNAKQTLALLSDELLPLQHRSFYTVNGDFLRHLTIEKREAPVIQGTYQTKDEVGHLRGYGIEYPDSLETFDGLLDSLGVLTREDLDRLRGSDLETVDRLTVNAESLLQKHFDSLEFTRLELSPESSFTRHS